MSTQAARKGCRVPLTPSSAHPPRANRAATAWARTASAPDATPWGAVNTITNGNQFIPP